MGFIQGQKTRERRTAEIDIVALNKKIKHKEFYGGVRIILDNTMRKAGKFSLPNASGRIKKLE